MNLTHKENYSLCIVFPMGIEAHPFLKRVETRNRSKLGKAILRRCFFEGREFLVLRSGIGPDKAARAVRSLDRDVDLILSVGTSGALTPDLSLGQMVVVGETVSATDSGEVIKSDQTVVRKLVHACNKVGQPNIVGRLVTSAKPVFARDERQKLHTRVCASAVDMESHVMAIEAKNRGISFAGLRVISDTVSSGPLPQKVDLKTLARNPLTIGKKLAPFMKWRNFIKQFFFAIGKLDPALVNFLRLS